MLGLLSIANGALASQMAGTTLTPNCQFCAHACCYQSIISVALMADEFAGGREQKGSARADRDGGRA